MITNSVDEAGVQAKLEEWKNEGVVSSCAVSSSSRRWSSFRNPRIVRVSRSFGGKDRHSKVCTIRGLRDRRIRLSVPTAIQIYYLQDKLGLSQPSKVIDWLLDATKEDIDKLPPLQMPLGFGQYHQQMYGDYTTGSRNLNDLLLSREPSMSQFSLSPFLPISNSTYTSKHGLKITDAIDGVEADDPARVKSAKYWDINLGLGSKKNEVLQRGLLDDEKGKSVEMNELQKNVGIYGTGTHHYAQLSAQNFFPLVGYSSFPSGMMNNAMPYSYSHWEPSNLSLSQFGGFQHQMAENFQNPNLVSSLPPPPPSISSAICPPTSVSPSLFPTYTPNFAASTENNSRQLNHFQLLSSSLSQPTVPSIHLSLPHLKPFQTDSYTKHFHHQENTRNRDDEEEAN